MSDLDLTTSLPDDQRDIVRVYARDFFLAGGILTLNDWERMHPSVRVVFVAARDEVVVSGATTLRFILRGGA